MFSTRWLYRLPQTWDLALSFKSLSLLRACARRQDVLLLTWHNQRENFARVRAASSDAAAPIGFCQHLQLVIFPIVSALRHLYAPVERWQTRDFSHISASQHHPEARK